MAPLFCSKSPFTSLGHSKTRGCNPLGTGDPQTTRNTFPHPSSRLLNSIYHQNQKYFLGSPFCPANGEISDKLCVIHLCESPEHGWQCFLDDASASSPMLFLNGHHMCGVWNGAKSSGGQLGSFQAIWVMERLDDKQENIMSPPWE